MKLLGTNPIDELILTLGDVKVRRDADGVPTAIRIMRPGAMSLTIDGVPITGTVDAEDIRSILQYHALKGELIPIDCEHLLQKIADAKGIEEAELVRSEKLLGEKAAAGMVSLKEEDGELWAHIEKLAGRARDLLSGAADALYGYFSPVLRGLKDGPLRITSLALTNLPAINGQELLAATEGCSRSAPIMATMRRHDNGGPTMKWFEKLIELLGKDKAALTAESADREPLFQAAVETIEGERGTVSDFLGQVRDALSLKDDDGLEAAAGKLLSVVEKAKGDTTALNELQTRVDELEGKERDRAVERLQAEGKLTEAMLPWARKQDTAALMEWAKDAPVVVQPGRTAKREELDPGDTQALSDVDRAIAQACGVDPAKVAEVHGLKA